MNVNQVFSYYILFSHIPQPHLPHSSGLADFCLQYQVLITA